MPTSQPSQGGPKPRTLNVSYVETLDPTETMHNQLLALFMRASPILANLAKIKDSDVHTGRLAEYFDSSANAHWAVLFPKSRRLVKEPSVTEAADFKKISVGLATLTRQVQSIASRMPTVSNPTTTTKPPAVSYAAAARSTKQPNTTNTTSPASNPQQRPRVVLRYPDQSAPLDPPLSLVRKFNERLESLGHKVKLSAVHRTPKGNLVVTGAPDTSDEALWAATPAMQNIANSGTLRPVTVYRDVKWSKVILHSVYTGKSGQNQPFSPDDCHSELQAHNPLYRELRITQRPSWIRTPSELENHSRSSLVLAFEDPDGKTLSKVLRQKVFYLFGERSPIRGWKKKKPTPRTPSHDAITPATGANTTACPTQSDKPASTPQPTITISGPDPFRTSKTRKGKMKTKPITTPGISAIPTQPDARPSQSTWTQNDEDLAAQHVAALDFTLQNIINDTASCPPAKRHRKHINPEEEWTDYMDSD
jgi:hypothetical protein